MDNYLIGSYFGPLSALAIFTIIVYRSNLFRPRIRNIFLAVVVVLVLLILASGFDYALDLSDHSSLVCNARRFTSTINFALAPVPVFLLGLIYRHQASGKSKVLYVMPLAVNLVISALSNVNGVIFAISNTNVYTRGPLFWLPYAITIFYSVALIYSSYGPKNKLNKMVETVLLLGIMTVVLLANVIEIFNDAYFLGWSTLGMGVILYYLYLAIQVNLYDPLTGALSRFAYTRYLDKIDGKSDCTIAMIDLNNLKEINDVFGHDQGDEAIKAITMTIDLAKRPDMRLFRYGGDEFVLMGTCNCHSEMNAVLEKARRECGELEGIKLAFSYGIAVYEIGDDLHDVIARADEMMYSHKPRSNRNPI